MLDQTIGWLLEKDNPSVRYFTLINLLGKDLNDQEVVSARQAIMREGPVPRILAAQNDDGSWGLPDKFYTDKYSGTVWCLLILAELAAQPDDNQVRKACEFILKHPYNAESGGFSYVESAKTGGGLPSSVIPCLTGNMVYSLIQLGYLDDSRVQKALSWITTWQRADDGDGGAPAGSAYDRLEMCWGRHSCHMGVAKALKALAAVPVERRSPEISGKIGELAEYFLVHHLFRKSLNLQEVSKPGWLRLSFPLMYQTDILELLGIFASLGIHDERLGEAIEKLAAKKQADGRWIMETSMDDRIPVRFDPKGKASKWMTLRALTTLRGLVIE